MTDCRAPAAPCIVHFRCELLAGPWPVLCVPRHVGSTKEALQQAQLAKPRAALLARQKARAREEARRRKEAWQGQSQSLVAGALMWFRGYRQDGDCVSGYGRLTKQDGEQYTGYWKSGKRHGHGRRSWADNTVYDGSYVDGMRHG